MEERLVSRFNWGLVTRIDPPSIETRLAIIRKKSRLRGIELPEDVANLIGARIKSSGRELEGALTRIQAIATVTGTINLEVTRQVLGDEGAVRHPVRVQDIMTVVTERYNVKFSEIQGRRRSKSIAFPRQVCMYLARMHTQHSLQEIGGFFGGRDHTTVLYATEKIQRLLESDHELRTTIDQLSKKLVS